MNIVKLQDDLKNVPDNALVGYVQNPSGQVPSYLALSELQRRKKMREQATGAQAQGQSQMPSVAEQLVAEAAPQPGIAGIPVTNVGNEDAYAAGGIVAFADGGSTEAYNRAARESFLGRGLGSVDEAMELIPSPGNLYKRAGGYFSDVLAGMRWVRNPYTGELVRAKDVVENPNAGALVQQPGMTNITGMLGMTQPDTSLGVPATPIAPELLKASQQGTDTGSVPTTKSAPSVGASSAGLQGLVAPKMEYIPMAEADMTPAGNARASMDEYKALIGEDPYAAKAAERIGKMESENAKYKEQYPWMALAEAGFGMAAGRSPFALQNIAEGGQRGVTALARGRKDVQEQEEKIFNAEAKRAEAERAVQLKAAEFGVNDSRTKDAARRLEKAKEREAQREIEYRNKVFEVDIEKLKVTERNATIRANAALAAADKRAKTEDQKLEIASLRSAISSAQANAVSARKAYSDAVKTMDPTEIASAKEDLTAALQSLQYYQNLAEGNLGGSGYKPTASQEAAFKKYAK